MFLKLKFEKLSDNAYNLMINVVLSINKVPVHSKFLCKMFLSKWSVGYTGNHLFIELKYASHLYDCEINTSFIIFQLLNHDNKNIYEDSFMQN